MKRRPRPSGSQGRAGRPASGTPLHWGRWAAVLGLLVVGSAAVLLYQGRSPRPVSDPATMAGTSTRSATQDLSATLPTSGATVPGTGTHLDPNTASRQKDASAAEFNQQASRLLATGDTAGAIRLLSNALALTPGDEDLHYNLGIAYSQSGDLTSAEREYREALRLLPDYPEVHNNLGNLLVRARRFGEAEEQFVQAIKAMPDYAKAHNNLGTLHQRQERTLEAMACFRKAVECDTNYWEAHFNLANACLSQTNLTEAVQHFRETLRLNPSFQAAQRALDRIQTQGSNQAPVLRK